MLDDGYECILRRDRWIHHRRQETETEHNEVHDK